MATTDDVQSFITDGDILRDLFPAINLPRIDETNSLESTSPDAEVHSRFPLSQNQDDQAECGEGLDRDLAQSLLSDVVLPSSILPEVHPQLTNNMTLHPWGSHFLRELHPDYIPTYETEQRIDGEIDQMFQVSQLPMDTPWDRVNFGDTHDPRDLMMITSISATENSQTACVISENDKIEYTFSASNATTDDTHEWMWPSPWVYELPTMRNHTVTAASGQRVESLAMTNHVSTTNTAQEAVLDSSLQPGQRNFGYGCQNTSCSSPHETTAGVADLTLGQPTAGLSSFAEIFVGYTPDSYARDEGNCLKKVRGGRIGQTKGVPATMLVTLAPAQMSLKRSRSGPPVRLKPMRDLGACVGCRFSKTKCTAGGPCKPCVQRYERLKRTTQSVTLRSWGFFDCIRDRPSELNPFPEVSLNDFRIALHQLRVYHNGIVNTIPGSESNKSVNRTLSTILKHGHKILNLETHTGWDEWFLSMIMIAGAFPMNFGQTRVGFHHEILETIRDWFITEFLRVLDKRLSVRELGSMPPSDFFAVCFFFADIIRYTTYERTASTRNCSQDTDSDYKLQRLIHLVRCIGHHFASKLPDASYRSKDPKGELERGVDRLEGDLRFAIATRAFRHKS